MRITTRSVAKSTLFAALILGVTQSLTTAVTAAIGWTAVQAIIVPGTGTQHPANVPHYLDNAVGHFLVPGGDCGAVTCSPVVGIEYDAQFWPIPLPGWGGLQGAKWNDSRASSRLCTPAILNRSGTERITSSSGTRSGGMAGSSNDSRSWAPSRYSTRRSATPHQRIPASIRMANRVPRTQR